MRRPVLIAPMLLLAAAPAPAQDGAEGICAARFSEADVLALEHRFVAILAGSGCRPGDLLHLGSGLIM